MRPAELAILALLGMGALHPATAQDAVPLDEATLQGDEVIDTPVGTIELQDSYFDDEASQRLFDEMDYQRAARPTSGPRRWSR